MDFAGNQLAGARSGGGLVDFSRIFPKDASVFLRYDQAGQTVNVAVTCGDVFSKTNVVTIVWPESEGQVQAPQVNAKVECVTMLRGRLMQFPARISGLHHDTRLTLMLALDQECRIVNLRKHERYRVFGWVSLREAAPTPSPEGRQPMDLSEGGFGACVAEPDLAVGQSCRFQLLADVYSSAEYSQSFPSLEISGAAILRRASNDGDTQQMRVGAQFSELPADDRQQLREWLAKNQSRLCHV